MRKMGISLGDFGYIQSPAEKTATKFFGGPDTPIVSKKFEDKVRQIVATQQGNGGGVNKATGFKPSGDSAPDNNKVSIDVGTETRYPDLADLVGSFFPPVQLLYNMGRDPIGTQKPAIKITGDPSAINQLQGPIAKPVSDDDLGLGKITGQFGSLITIAIPLLLIGFAASTLKSFKGLFS